MRIVQAASFATLAVSAMLSAAPTSAQTAPAHVQAIVASFNKSKHVVKERRGVRVEKFKEIRSVPAIKADPREYSGSYESPGSGFRLDLRVDALGNVSGSGADPIDADGQTLRTFTLAGAKVDGALLTATKVFANGRREHFEAVFINETTRDNPNDAGTTTFGLGALITPRVMSGLTIEKVFYQVSP